MEYYDYYDFDDEINIAVREYKNTKGEVETLQTEIDELQKKQGVLIEEKDKETNDILKRKYDREISDNLNEIKQREEKINGIRENIQGKIDIAKEKLSKKLEEKDSKIEMSEKNVEAVKGQLDIVTTQIEEIKSKSDKELSQAIKESMLMGLESKQAEYEKMMEEFMKNSETLALEKMDVEELDTNLSLLNMENFIQLWDRVTQESVKVQNPVMSTPTTPVSTPTNPVSTPTAPASTPTRPVSTPTNPVSTPTAPASTPTRPVSTPTAPASTPTAPASTPTRPVSTPTRPVSTPTAPASTPTRPASTPSTPASTPSTPASTPVKAKIKGIKIGKQLEIEYENSDKKSVKIDFKRMKQLMKQTPEEKEKMVREVLKNSNIRNISKDTLKLIDPNVIYAFQNAKKHKVEEKDVEEQVLGYIYALKGDKNYQDKVRGLITYDRTGMDYWKPSTFFSKIVNGKWYKKLDSYSNKAKDFTDAIFDLPGKLRMALGKKDTKLLEKAKESTVDRNKRISEKATQELSGNSQKTEQSKNIRKDVKVSDEVAKKLRKVEEEFKKQETVRDSIKSDTYKKMEEKASKEGFSK